VPFKIFIWVELKGLNVTVASFIYICVYARTYTHTHIHIGGDPYKIVRHCSLKLQTEMCDCLESRLKGISRLKGTFERLTFKRDR